MSEFNEGNGNARTEEREQRGAGPAPEAFARVTPEPPPAPPRKPFYKRPLVLIIGTILIVTAIAVGLIWWLYARQFESTDDAFIAADVTQVSPRVAGHVQQVYVNDNELVAQGAKLLDLDPRDLQAKVNEAQAAVEAAEKGLDQAKENAASQRANVGQYQAAEEAARTEAERAHNEQQRFERLSSEAVTQQQLINLRAASATADANLAAARQKTLWAQANVKSADAQIQVSQALIQQSQAALNETRLQISYTTITAPIAGYVTNKSVQPGDYLQVGQAVMGVVPREVYVIANFKETQLDLMRPGQDVTITLDAYHGRLIYGKVDGIQRGSGAAFSLLPPENATGNYVKVVQRVPVKITFQAPRDLVLGPGMSVVPKVKVR